MKAVQKFYSVSEIGFLMGFGAAWVRARVPVFAQYGAVVKIDADFRISAAAINGFLDARLVASVEEAMAMAGVPARSETELKRKVRGGAKGME